jgi:hypothetical protein
MDEAAKFHTSPNGFSTDPIFTCVIANVSHNSRIYKSTGVIDIWST